MKKRDSQPTPLFQNPEADGSSFEWMTDSNTGVVCLHGFTATTVEVRTFAEELNKMGYCVNGPLLPGHGVSPEEMNKVKWEDWFDAADSAFQSMERQCENIFLAGESTGALLSLLFGHQTPSGQRVAALCAGSKNSRVMDVAPCLAIQTVYIQEEY